MDMQARDAEIVRLVSETRKTQAAIGQQFGMTGARVYQIAKSHGVCRGQPKLPAEAVDRAANLIARGMPINHAAESTGLNRGSLFHRLVRDGRYTPAKGVVRPWTSLEEAELRNRYGTRWGEAGRLARDLKRTRNEIIGKAHRMGLSKPLQEMADA